MKYKMIVLDLDDTLLRDDLTISSYTRASILSAQMYGTKVVIATGRPTCACMSIAKEIGLEKYGGYIISFNGAVITEARTGKKLRQVSITKEKVHELYALSKQHNSYIQTYDDFNIITPENNEYTKIEQKLTGMNIEEVNDFVSRIDSDVIKVILLQEPSILKTISDKLKPIIPQDLNMTFSKPFFLEFTNKEVDKAVSVKYLANYLNIDMKSTIAIGDSYNDISMVKQAGLGVAMSNGVDAIKEVANYLARSNMEDGVAEVIYRFILVEGIINSYNESTADSISA